MYKNIDLSKIADQLIEDHTIEIDRLTDQVEQLAKEIDDLKIELQKIKNGNIINILI